VYRRKHRSAVYVALQHMCTPLVARTTAAVAATMQCAPALYVESGSSTAPAPQRWCSRDAFMLPYHLESVNVSATCWLKTVHDRDHQSLQQIQQ
jgi:hypothetical protein